MLLAKEDLFHCSVKALIQNDNGDVLVLRYNAQFKPHLAGRWDLPGGRIDRGEVPHQALIRELNEELALTNVTIDKHCLMAFAPQRINLEAHDVGLIMSIFHCTIQNGDNIQLSSEHELLEWVPLHEAAHRLTCYYPHEFITLLHASAGKQL